MITSAVPCRLMRFGRGTLFRRAWMAEIPFEEGALTMFERRHRLTGHSIGMTFTSRCSVLARADSLIATLGGRILPFRTNLNCCSLARP